MIRPNFFIVGAPRCGTTSLADNMSQHPDVFIPSVKEPFYFVEGVRYNDFGEYMALFNDAGDAKAVGEASTGYIFDEGAPAAIRENFPDAKIIIILRDPVEMSFSHWRFVSMTGDEKLSFEDAVSENERAYRKTDEFKRKVYWYGNFLHLERALYHGQVKRYFDTFGRGQVKVFIFEEFIKDQTKAYAGIFEFLGIDRGFLPDFKVSNEGGEARFGILKAMQGRDYPLLKKLVPTTYRVSIRKSLRRFNTKPGKVEMEPSTRAMLEDFFREDIKKLEALLGRGIAAWKRKA